MQEKSTINLKEISKFASYAKNWWNESCKETQMLHKMNPLRLEYIISKTNVKGAKMLDVGCGGGILSIPLSRLGAEVYGLEPAKESFEIALKKAQEEELEINFVNSSIEDYNNENFDTILLMDVIEHVQNPEVFLEIVAKKLKSQGILIISTINSTLLSKIFVKFVAENVLRIIPKGTHDEKGFISPEKIQNHLKGFELIDISGFTYNPITQKFHITKSYKMNYFLTLRKCHPQTTLSI